LRSSTENSNGSSFSSSHSGTCAVGPYGTLGCIVDPSIHARVAFGFSPKLGMRGRVAELFQGPLLDEGNRSQEQSTSRAPISATGTAIERRDLVNGYAAVTRVQEKLYILSGDRSWNANADRCGGLKRAPGDRNETQTRVFLVTVARGWLTFNFGSLAPRTRSVRKMRRTGQISPPTLVEYGKWPTRTRPPACSRAKLSTASKAMSAADGDDRGWET